MARAVIHINVADFAVAVARCLDTGLRERPVIVAPDRAVRAVVFDMSDEAYHQGVRKQMPLAKALRRCPDARVIVPQPARYEQAMRRLLAHVLPFSPRVEMTDTNGHVFVDATGTGRLFGDPQDVAWRIRKAVRADMGLDPIWSVATNKLVAKVASRLVKPLGEYSVRPGEEAAFLAPLPLGLVPGIRMADRVRLGDFNLTRVGQVARLSTSQLAVMVGERSAAVADVVRGVDPLPVGRMDAAALRVTGDHAFGDDTNAPDRVAAVLYVLVAGAGRQLRRDHRAARRVTVAVEHSDGGRCFRAGAVRPASADDDMLFAAAYRALHAAWTRRVRVRHLRLICDRLMSPPGQLALFVDDQHQRTARTRLMGAMDAIRDRFGEDALQVGRVLTAS